MYVNATSQFISSPFSPLVTISLFSMSMTLFLFGGIYLEKVIIQKYTCTPIFIATLFTKARTWKQPKCPLTDEWTKKMWYTYIHIHKGMLVSHKKINNAICSNMDGLRDHHTEWSKSEGERQVSCDITYIWTTKKKKVQMNLFTKSMFYVSKFSLHISITYGT